MFDLLLAVDILETLRRRLIKRKNKLNIFYGNILLGEKNVRHANGALRTRPCE